MSSDMVASLTLRLQDQMSGGVGEIKALFTNLNATLDTLNATLGGMQDLMANLRGPTQLMTDLQAVNTQAQAAADTMAASLQSVSVGVDADIVKIKEMYAALGQGTAMMPPGATAPGTFYPDAMLPPGMGPTPPVPPEEPEQKNPKAAKMPGGIMDWFMGAFAVLSGKEAWGQYNDFYTIANQAALTEGLHGAAADTEAHKIMRGSYTLAIAARNNQRDIEQTYAYLIRDSIPKHVVDQLMPSIAEASTAYNVPLNEMDKAIFTLYKNFGIGADQMGTGLAVMHHAAMTGLFGMEDFSMYLPTIGGQMSLMGMSGLGADITGASALETIRKNTGTSGEAATDLQDMLFYLHSPMGLRMFDQTKRMRDLMGPSGEALLNKYHVQPIDLPKYLNDERSKGVDPINAMADYFTKLLANVSSPTDRADIVGSMIHNQGAQNAILDLVQYNQDFKNYQKNLGGVTDSTLGQDFKTAIQGSVGDLAAFDTNLTNVNLQFGRLAGIIYSGGTSSGPLITDQPPAAKPAPVELHVHVYGKGDVRVTQGPSSGPPARGQVLNRH